MGGIGVVEGLAKNILRVLGKQTLQILGKLIIAGVRHGGRGAVRAPRDACARGALSLSRDYTRIRLYGQPSLQAAEVGEPDRARTAMWGGPRRGSEGGPSLPNADGRVPNAAMSSVAASFDTRFSTLSVRTQPALPHVTRKVPPSPPWLGGSSIRKCFKGSSRLAQRRD